MKQPSIIPIKCFVHPDARNAREERVKCTPTGLHSEMEKRQTAEGKMAKKWIQKAIKHKGALHEELGVPEDKKIPKKKIKKAEHSKNPTLRKRAQLAETLGKLRKKK